MKVYGKTVVVTGGAKGIGRALALRFAKEGAKHVAVADLDEQAAREVAQEIGGSAHGVDVSSAAAIAKLVDDTERQHGPIDLFCSNAGILIGEGLDTPDDVWRTMLDVNVMAHVYAARVLIPRMVARGA